MKSGKKADYDYIHGIFLEECKNRFLCNYVKFKIKIYMSVSLINTEFVGF